jgi:hypothetical protein
VRCALVNINQYWAANILEEDIEIDDNTLQELIEVNDKYTKLYAHVPDVLDENRVGYNVFDDDSPAVQSMREYVKERTYNMMEAEGFINPRKYDIEAVCIAREFENGERAKVHNHRGCDYVAVLYLDLDVVETGDNFKKPGGRLLLTDPISQRSRALNHTQNVDFTPHPKWFVMHPAYIYHQSEPYLGTKDRKFFVFVIRIVEPIQMPYYRKL